MQIRPAAAADLADIQSIYAHHVLHGTGTFEEQPPSVEEMAGRHAQVTGRGWPWLVAQDDTGVTGFGYWQQFRDRSAYRCCAEDSIYIRDDVRGQGVGKALLALLLDSAERAGIRQMIAVIGDAENVGSVGVHSSMGFRHVGVLHKVGFKFGRWLDVVQMQKQIGPGEATAPGI